MTNLHLYIDQDELEIAPDNRKSLTVNYNLHDEAADFVTSVELHISDPDMDTWPKVLREIIAALEELYGYNFDLSDFEK
jgi:hypothetical protein